LELEGIREIVIDTYVLLAIVYDEISNRARNILDSIYRRGIIGIIPITVVYEYIIHWLRESVPTFKNIDEAIIYLQNYFRVVGLSFDDYIGSKNKD